MYKYLIGIDEAGRGPLAGPVTVGVVCVRPDFNWDTLAGVDDSKKLTAQKREEVYTQACAMRTQRQLAFSVGFTSSTLIDKIGIVPAVNRAMRNALHEVRRELSLDPSFCYVKLDGSLRAPDAYVLQETIIKGDQKEKIIGLASIVAKVTRDRYMIKLGSKRKYAAYNFQIHKGYGTKRHREAIVALGLSDVHRKYFCQRLMEEKMRGIV